MLLGQTTRSYGFSIWFVILILMITINTIKAMTQLFFVLFIVLVLLETSISNVQSITMDFSQ